MKIINLKFSPGDRIKALEPSIDVRARVLEFHVRPLTSVYLVLFDSIQDESKEQYIAQNVLETFYELESK